ncbi:MAG: family 16 glycosylhydrolase, partial [Thermoflavifilum sp.]|nr:family 16 glycosylhydrolase [Thermoflavifilum sp.]
MKCSWLLTGLMSCALQMIYSCSKSSNTPSPETTPAITISDVTLARQPRQDMVFRFYLGLSKSTAETVSVHYATQPGTAQANRDFIPDSGNISFAPGSTQAYVDITVKADSLRQANQEFYLVLSNPQHATLSRTKAVATILNQDLPYLPTSDSGYSTPLSYAGYRLVWHDEFDEASLADTNWNYETGGGGWGNQELEYYTSRPQNVFLSQGHLVIEARQENYGNNAYTSARITTQGKKEFQYGRIDIRAKLPVVQGMWPALWMLGSNIKQVGWPQCGEIDIMELIGKNPREVVGSFHWKKADGSEGTFNNRYDLPVGDFSNAFHVFSLLWDADSLQILVDDQPYVKASRQDLSNGPYPFDQPFFLIFNVAVGGNWPGPPDATTPFPQRMFVDYVR